MKRVNYMSAGLIAMTLAGVMLPITSVFAADEPIKKTSVGEVRVGVDPDNPDPNNPDNPDGSKDILSLVKVPDLKFKSVSVEQLATGQQTLLLTSNTVTDKPVKNEPAGNASDGNNQGLLNITDYRGTGAGWKLEAQAGELKNAAGQKLAGSLLLAGVAKTDETDNNPTAISQAELVLEGSGVCRKWSRPRPQHRCLYFGRYRVETISKHGCIRWQVSNGYHLDADQRTVLMDRISPERGQRSHADPFLKKRALNRLRVLRCYWVDQMKFSEWQM